MKRLEGKVAIVTGAAPQSQGLGNGSAVALSFAKEGAKVVLVNRSKTRVNELAKEIKSLGEICIVCMADVTQEEEVKNMIEKTLQVFGKIDILYNNVGGNTTHPHITDMTLDDWYKGLNFNLTSTMLCCKYVISHMIDNGGGSIINASSIAAIKGIRDSETSLLTYSVAKAGLGGLMRTLSAEYSSDGIRVNNIIIGMVETPLVVNKQGAEVLDKRLKHIPLQVSGTGMDTAWAAIYLASDESRWVTGSELIIDGGQTQILHRPR